VYRKYGILKSVSESYYHVKHKAIFTLVLWGFAIPVIIAASSPIMFFAVVGICFVGVAPAFRGWVTERRVHLVGATSGIVLGMASLWIEYHMWYIVVAYVALFAILMLKRISSFTFWIEIFAFYFILAGLLISKI